MNATDTLGAMFAKAHPQPERKPDGLYMALVKKAIAWPKTVLIFALALLVGVQYAYSQYGAGVEFFPNVEPDYGLLYVHARGNLSLAEMDLATHAAESRILGWPGVKDVRVGKLIEFDFAGDDPAGEARKMCDTLLANTVIESFRVELA